MKNNHKIKIINKMRKNDSFLSQKYFIFCIIVFSLNTTGSILVVFILPSEKLRQKITLDKCEVLYFAKFTTLHEVLLLIGLTQCECSHWYVCLAIVLEAVGLLAKE